MLGEGGGGVPAGITTARAPTVPQAPQGDPKCIVHDRASPQAATGYSESVQIHPGPPGKEVCQVGRLRALRVAAATRPRGRHSGSQGLPTISSCPLPDLQGAVP